MRLATVVALVLALAAARPVAAQPTCNLNGVGPDGLVLTVPGPGTDFDLGWTGDYHDLAVPGGARFEACLTNCDTTSDPLCDVAGYAGGQSAAGRPFTPPIPVAIGTVAACVVTTFQEPFATGTANIETGAIDVLARLSADVYLTMLTAVCPVCSGTDPGDPGTCAGGANAGGACTTDAVVTVENATAGNPYRVSRDCLPSGSPLSVAFSLTVTTGTSTRDTPCPGQTGTDDCSAACGSGNCTGAGNGSGVSQNCCTDDTSKRCFVDPVVRTGSPAMPLPAWPDLTYPKSASETIVSAFCAPGAPGIPGIVVNQDVGLPGPAAFIFPSDAEWTLDSTPTTTTPTTSTTSSTVPGATTTTTLPPGCTGPADCADGDDCTDDLCTASVCSNPLLAGIDGVQCALGQISPPALCPGETIIAKLLNTITKKLAATNTQLGKAEAAPNAAKRAKALKKARAALQKILTKAAKFGTNGKITPACAEAIRQAISALQQAIPTS